MPKILTVVLLVSLTVGAEVDSVAVKTPQKAALYGFLMPGGGQIYNGKYFKAGLVLGCEILATWRFLENRDNYQNYDSTMELRQGRYLEKRNKYAWWMAFIYIYGVLDAMVDAHLEPFDELMQEDLEGMNPVNQPNETEP